MNLAVLGSRSGLPCRVAVFDAFGSSVFSKPRGENTIKNLWNSNDFQNPTSAARRFSGTTKHIVRGIFDPPGTSFFAIRPLRNSIFIKLERPPFSTSFPRRVEYLEIEKGRFSLYLEQKSKISGSEEGALEKLPFQF